jgi:hypothetical protein
MIYNWPFFITWCILRFPSIVPNAWNVSRICWASFKSCSFVFMACICSLNPVLNVLPVWPINFRRQPEHVSWLTLLWLHFSVSWFLGL